MGKFNSLDQEPLVSIKKPPLRGCERILSSMVLCGSDLHEENVKYQGRCARHPCVFK